MRGNAPLAESVSFPDTYSTLSTERLREAFAAAPGRIEASLAGMTEERVRARPIPGKWSIHEIVLHAADSECVGAVRIRQAIGDDRVRFPSYDQDRWSATLRYAERSSGIRGAMLRLFRAQREASSELFAAATPQEWRREGIHPEWGPLSLRQLLELYADHGERHLSQILERRALLGEPLDLPPLLPLRLY